MSRLYTDKLISHTLMGVILYALLFHLGYCEKIFDGGNLKNISNNNTLKGSYKAELFRNKIDAFNPVLQNYSALEDWLEKKQSITRFLPAKVNSTGSRTKRSSSLWCDGGQQCSLSLCPWRELVDAQHSRSPVNIKYAECLTTNCNYNFPGVSQFTQNILNMFTTCDVVRTDIRVVEHGRVKFITDWPIACLCTQHRMYAPITEDTSNLSQGEVATGSIRIDENNIGTVHHVQNTEPRRPAIFGYQYPQHVSSRQRHLRRLYRMQQRRRQNTETFDELMRRRQRESYHNRS